VNQENNTCLIPVYFSTFLEKAVGAFGIKAEMAGHVPVTIVLFFVLFQANLN